MKVLNLQCSRQHSFEGWFGSEEDFQNQSAQGMIECPLCADKEIQKMPAAPRLNFGGRQSQYATETGISEMNSAAAQATASSENTVAGNSTETSSAAQAEFFKVLRRAVAHTEDVGRRFADEARRMHYGEVAARSIRGQASAREAVELIEEGINVMPLPLPAALKETLQ